MQGWDKAKKREFGKLVGLCGVFVLALLWAWFLEDGPRDLVAGVLREMASGAPIIIIFLSSIYTWRVWCRRVSESGGANGAD